MNTKELDSLYIAKSYGRLPLEITGGKGSLCYDENGKEYIDLGSGIAVNTFGFSDPEWMAAIKEQIDKFAHTSNYYYTEPCAKLAQLLCEKTGMKKVFFSNSGGEANECAIKAARRYSFQKYGKGRHTIITLKNSFHGRTITTLSATGQDSFHTEFDPFTEGFVYAEANNLSEVKKLSEDNNCCAVMMEIVQGEGGVFVLSKEFVEGVYELCCEKDMLLIIDEVQTGNGRTGKLYGYMNYNIEPDIISTAKGLGGGLPIGATLFSEKTAEVYTPGSHGSTFGGNPVCAAGAVNIISRIDDELLAGVAERHSIIKEKLMQLENVESVDGLGLMLGIKCKKDAKEIMLACLERGVLVLTAKDKVRLLPPLNIDIDLLNKALNILSEVILQ
ncbi:MAG: acetylornithine/succinylornithine family transaminase [Clostridia bacterium]|nr:acetylornithine/succinylornithine family transaminase [Clostridia bacterium]